jgi:DNA-binding response OmpR family regulator
MTKKILIVEDEEHILELLLRIFDRFDEYETFYAKDGEEALRIVVENNPDIVLLNLWLPKVNGLDVCKSLKSDPAQSQIRVIMISGSATESDWEKAYEAGADACIVKPFRITTIIEKVENVLRNNQ